MNNYTPATDEVLEPTDMSVRQSFMYAQLAVRGLNTNMIGTELTVKLSTAFDRWLAAHDREVAAKAWGEGYEAGQGDEAHWSRGLPSDPGADEHPHDNPYAALMSEPSTPMDTPAPNGRAWCHTGHQCHHWFEDECSDACDRGEHHHPHGGCTPVPESTTGTKGTP